ncbi:MAG: hypothetical protein A2Y45_03605 [Tenericutes bacterium GWC2_34_14]|nr:MAG: hypothetical protein US32_C0002G0004 [candidate division TM6 bacterium GW2011_GWA2_36_9]OHE29220.1 MAG: hypothetical protein A2Y45_03605 [Tenericutes bacterium GWC2_34_14]OHE34303.1 MAG: hypothetical protein A2012_09195 [Tenericutes bacterium GWE2_34_108]OHE35655.1 MAG: hypothetical protein A2Y46_05960 [Tenericutes bacterium GWF1_35_14]OHE38870.1 MAG: hypothetical protein A2Y44_00395 [Tenericutes bacterium GWF2_35_184]OHE43902.1 MAG: hypothetical protein A2221_10290 [Tenericutes bacter
MGTIINAIAIVVATILGIIFKKGLPEKIQKGVMVSLGIGLIALSLGWFLKDFFAIENNTLTTEGDLLIIVSLVIGVIIGEWIDIEERLNKWAEGIEKKYNLPPLAKGFIAATLIFCVGAMAIVGSIKDGLYGDMTTLLIKSALDFVTAMILASVLGIGVIFSAISVLIYQGAITLLAMFGANMLSPEIIHSLSMVGNILLIGIGINFLEIKRIKVANMLPALLIPIIYHLIMTLF